MFKKLRIFIFALSGSAAALFILHLLHQRGPKNPHSAGLETRINVDEVPAETVLKMEQTPETKPVEKNASKPAPAVVAPVSTSDDLKRIEGIGPKTADILNQAGILTFKALAALTPEEIKTILRAAKGRGVPTSWPQQAKLAAAADWDGLAKLQAELKGGL
jgi:large subunit ribosomal protein L21